MECGWDTLVKQIDTAETLEDVIQVKFLIFPPPSVFSSIKFIWFV